MLDLPEIPGVLRTFRLRQFAALDANCPLPLKALLQAVDAKPLSWTVSVAEDLRQMHSWDLKLRQFPDPDEGLPAWRAVYQSSQLLGGRERRVARGGVGRAPTSHLPSVRNRFSIHASPRADSRHRHTMGHKDFRTHAHVSSIACRDALLAGEVHLLPPEVVWELDAQDADPRSNSRHSGHSFLAIGGPMRLPE